MNRTGFAFGAGGEMSVVHELDETSRAFASPK